MYKRQIHDKGVLILSGYLGSRYGKEKPLSITTSITFEQNYNGVDGDSASSTELYAIISSICLLYTSSRLDGEYTDNVIVLDKNSKSTLYIGCLLYTSRCV